MATSKRACVAARRATLDATPPRFLHALGGDREGNGSLSACLPFLPSLSLRLSPPLLLVLLVGDILKMKEKSENRVRRPPMQIFL
ncbi:hypothetical protein E2C01_041548 [Portunus trituberculatus]|uniref:Uncharacterized protein n=1 Tax=Portunus trituberculatus TaxID=210409 RepID=A0A5B7FK98_PORTR|nr:hypothetical protein [Portunus trituberculatus]